jgi:hypothetical protein
MSIEGSLARRLGEAVWALSLAALGCGGGEPKSTQGVEGLAGPFLRFLVPMGGETLTGLSPVQFELQFPADQDESTAVGGLPPPRSFLALGIDDQPPVPMTESPGVLALKTYSFDNGPHRLVGVLSDALGHTWEDSVDVLFDNPAQQLRGYQSDKTEYRDGEQVVLQLDFGEPALQLSADFEQLDRFYPRGGARISELGAGRYEIRYTISTSNTLPDGVHSVWVEAKDAAGASVRHGVPVRLRNAPLPPMVVQGGWYVDAPPPALDTPSEPSAAIASVNGPPVILTGGVAEFNVSWTQPPGAPAQKLLVRAQGYSGYFVVPLPDTAGAATGQAKIRVYLPASAPGAFDEGTFNFLFSIVDTIGQVIDAVSETVQHIVVGSGGVQVALSWDTDADLDIGVTDPAGNLIDFANPIVGVGALDLDSNAMCVIDGKRAENIAWQALQEPQGIYQIRVNLYQACMQTSAQWHIIATYCGRTEEYDGVFSAADADESGTGRAVATFTVDCSQRVSGRVSYDKRNTILPIGSTPTTVETPVPFAPVRVISTGTIATTLAEGVTDLDGRYAFAFSNLDEDNYRVEVEAAYVEPTSGDVVARVARVDEAETYRFKSPDILGAGSMVQTQDFHFTVPDGAGAFNVLAGIRTSYDWIKRSARSEDTEDLSPIKANWELGGATPKGAACQPDRSGCPFSFQVGEELWINGDADSQDEWDETVIAHEYSHFIIRKLSLGDLPGGPHGGKRSSPDLSWSEGLATALGQRALGRSLYASESKNSSFTVDIESGTQDISQPGNFLDTSDHTATGNVIEWLDSMIVWDLLDPANEPHDRISKEPFSLNILFDPPPAGKFIDRAGNGVDLVDYLDHFRSGSVQRFDRELMCLVLERQFPYDGFSVPASCPP